MQPNGTFTYRQCTDDLKLFKLDLDKTSNTPDPVSKGTEISFNLAGSLKEDVNVTKINIHVDYLTTVYSDNTTQVDKSFNASSALNFLEKWQLPSDAPPGDYTITFTYTGSSKGEPGSVLCVVGVMHLAPAQNKSNLR